MDTIRIKFNCPAKPDNAFFKEEILTKKITSEYANGAIYIHTNNDWRNEQKGKGRYMPKYGIEEDFIGRRFFYIECSLPKLLFGHSAKELKN